MNSAPTYLNPSVWQRILSYFGPLLLHKAAGAFHESLEIYLYRSQLQLATQNALYSDGIRYMPFRIVFDAIGARALANRRNCLILGCGLGSNVQMLWDRYRCRAHYTLVEQEPLILDWCRAILQEKGIRSLTAELGDVVACLPQLPKSGYDLICVDVFKDQVVPPEVVSSSMLHQIKDRLSAGGIWILNYMEISPDRDATLLLRIREVFPEYKIRKKRRNIIYWGKVS